MEIDVLVHHDRETHSYWAETPQLAGCFAGGHTREELEDSINEAISLYLEGEAAAEVLTSDHIEAVEHYRFSDDEGLVPADFP